VIVEVREEEAIGLELWCGTVCEARVGIDR
jgi:hypothetical protein